MLLKTLSILTLSVVYITAEAPIQKSGPYPPSGWRPRKPFNFPREYLPPTLEAEQQQQRQQEPAFANVEINRERVDFLGQTQDSKLSQINRRPHLAYGPPNKDLPEFLGEQQLPFENAQQQYSPRPQQQQQQNPPKPPVQFGQRPPFPQKAPNFQGEQSTKPQEANSAQRPAQQASFFPTVALPIAERKPAVEYGAPSLTPPANRMGKDFNIIYPDPRSLEDDAANNKELNEDEDGNSLEKPLTPIEALNAAIDAYNRAVARSNRAQTGDNNADSNVDGYPYDNKNNSPDAEDPQPTRATMGQYFVLGPDKTLQRVTFTTSQDEEEQQSNAFTAQLKYRPVGELKDPVFRYNNQGQLVRVLKK